MSDKEIIFETLKLLFAIFAAGFTYFKYFREGTHKQRIEFDIDCCDLGIVGKERIIEIGCTAENKGNVEQRFDNIRLKVRGIEVGISKLSDIKGCEPRLTFSTEIAKASLIPAKWNYFFVRPGVKQRFPLVMRAPAKCTHIHVRSTFRYKGTDDIHSAERAFAFKCQPLEEYGTAV
jgi:hypothetical protein